MMPKHVPIPDIPADSELLFELITLIYTAMALGLQYLNLYRTVWWLPHSHVKYAINFYLIDPYLVGFIIILLARRFLWCIFKQLINKYMVGYTKRLLLQVFRIAIGLIVLAGLTWCSYYIVQTHPLVNMFYLCYPISIYFILFGANVSAFFDLTPPISSLSTNKGSSNKSQQDVQRTLQHLCYFSPEAVRDEVELLKTDFNNRMKQVLFNSLLSAYYTGFIPCCFAQSVLHYDVCWVTQHLGFTWLSCFTMYVVHSYPPRYCDILHRSALHLGRWQRIETRNLHIPYSPWSDTILWHQGALVKHTKELFRAEGITNAAEPGNATHSRFYAVFMNPSLLLCSLLGLQFVMVVAQMVLLVRSSEWNQIISISLLLFSNYYTLFKLSRDYLILWKIYRAEQLIQEQMNN